MAQEREITRFSIKLENFKNTTKALLFSVFVVIKWVLYFIYILLYPIWELLLALFYLTKYWLITRWKIEDLSMDQKNYILQKYEKEKGKPCLLNWGCQITNKLIIKKLKKDLEGN